MKKILRWLKDGHNPLVVEVLICISCTYWTMHATTLRPTCAKVYFLILVLGHILSLRCNAILYYIPKNEEIIYSTQYLLLHCKAKNKITHVLDLSQSKICQKKGRQASASIAVQTWVVPVNKAGLGLVVSLRGMLKFT